MSLWCQIKHSLMTEFQLSNIFRWKEKTNWKQVLVSGKSIHRLHQQPLEGPSFALGRSLLNGDELAKVAFRAVHQGRNFLRYIRKLDSPNGHPLTLATLCPYSLSIFLQFRKCQDALYTGLETLQRNMRAKVAGASSSVPGPQLAVDELFEELDEESDVDSVV